MSEEILLKVQEQDRGKRLDAFVGGAALSLSRSARGKAH